MDKLINNYRVSISRAFVGFLLLYSGFYVATKEINSFFSLIAPYSIMITGLIAFFIAFGPTSIKDLFSRPSDPKGNVKNFFKYFVLTTFLGFTAAILLKYIFHVNLAANPVSGNILSIIYKIPFMLLGEELISFYILLVLANFVYKKTNDQKQAELIGIIFSSIIFGLLHYSTYYSGNPLSTLAHILLIQGSARIAFNLSGLKSNSIIIPLIIHIVYDLIFLSFS